MLPPGVTLPAKPLSSTPGSAADRSTPGAHRRACRGSSRCRFQHEHPPPPALARRRVLRRRSTIPPHPAARLCLHGQAGPQPVACTIIGSAGRMANSGPCLHRAPVDHAASRDNGQTWYWRGPLGRIPAGDWDDLAFAVNVGTCGSTITWRHRRDGCWQCN